MEDGCRVWKLTLKEARNSCRVVQDSSILVRHLKRYLRTPSCQVLRSLRSLSPGGCGTWAWASASPPLRSCRPRLLLVWRGRSSCLGAHRPARGLSRSRSSHHSACPRHCLHPAVKCVAHRASLGKAGEAPRVDPHVEGGSRVMQEPEHAHLYLTEKRKPRTQAQSLACQEV